MARKTPQPKATSSEVLECVQQNCSSCGKPMWNEYNNLRRVRTLKGVVQLLLKIRRCRGKHSPLVTKSKVASKTLTLQGF